VEDAVEYAFAGHREVKKQLRSPLVDVDEMLLCFGETQKAARRSYLRAIRIGSNPDAPDTEATWHPFHIAKDSPLQANADAHHVDVLGRTTDLERPTLEAAEFIRQVCELAGYDFEHIASRARDSDTAGKRRLVVTLGVERWRQKGRAMAAVLNKNPDVVSWWVGEGIRRRLEDDEFATQLEELDKQLSAALARRGER